MSISAPLVMVESSEMRLYKNPLVGRILSPRPPPRRCHGPRLMPPAADREQEEGPSPRPPPSIRQETWGIVANYLKDIYRRGWVGQACSLDAQKLAKMARYKKGATEMKRTEEQEWAVVPTNSAALIPNLPGAGGS